MRIALVSLHTSPTAVPGSGDAGGMNVVVAQAAQALVRRGHEVVMVTRASSQIAAGEYAVDPGSSLIALPAGPADLLKAHLPEVVPEFAAGLRTLGSFDAVHSHYWLSGAASHSAFADSPFTPVVTFHTLAAQKNARLAPGDTPEPEVRLAGERALTQNSFVVAGSHNEQHAIHTHYGVPPLGSEIVHPGVDTRLFAPHDDSSPHDGSAQFETSVTSGQRFRITVLGRVQPLKGQDLAVRAMGELALLDPLLASQTELVISGEPTPGAEPYAAGLHVLAKQLGISDRVLFLPAQSRVQAAALLASSSLVLVPSHSETFGLTALEAGSCGVPVVVGGHTGLVEAAPANTSGVHMVDRDPRHWAETIAALLHDPHRRERISKSAREHALTHDWSQHAAALERIYAKARSTRP